MVGESVLYDFALLGQGGPCEECQGQDEDGDCREDGKCDDDTAAYPDLCEKGEPFYFEAISQKEKDGERA